LKINMIIYDVTVRIHLASYPLDNGAVSPGWICLGMKIATHLHLSGEVKNDSCTFLPVAIRK
jgi:hypothetical protein